MRGVELRCEFESHHDTASLNRLGIGWCAREQCWTFPLSDATHRIVGINRRYPNGTKRVIAGGRVGLYMPDGLDTVGRLLIAEGATDCAALLDVGFTAVGRFSCATCTRDLIELTRRSQPADVVIVADQGNPGRRGAHDLATALTPFVLALRTIAPPNEYADARAWRQAGATHNDFIRTIESAPVRRLGVSRG